MISNTAEYALRAIVLLATKAGLAHTAQEIAVQTKVPAGYLSKVLQDLAKARIVISQRGPTGGFTLAREADQISVLEVINAVDPIQRIRSCPLGLPEHGTKLCTLHQRLDDTMAYVEKTFAQTTIADMIKPVRRDSQCVFPTVEGTAPKPRSKRS
jgi:Rrf2 family nitric oxide-sensitive transcriptional repressor